jgi:hypothetical protein
LTGFWRNIDGWWLEAKAEIKRATQRRQEKPGKTQKVTVLAFEVVFFAGFFYPFAPSPKAPTSGALNNHNLCFGYKRLV